MQREFAGLKTDVKKLDCAVQIIGADLKELRGTVEVLRADVKDLHGTVDALGADVKDLRGVVRNLAVKVVQHDERFDRIDEKLKKLEVLDQIKNTTDALAGELRASRAERALSDKSVRDQQTTLTDHELRLTRLERRGKPS